MVGHDCGCLNSKWYWSKGAILIQCAVIICRFYCLFPAPSEIKLSDAEVFE